MAQTFLTLPLIPKPFAQNGNRTNLPEESTGTNRASFDSGWGDITSKPIDQGGVPPNRLDFNSLGWIATVFAFAMQEGKFWTFDLEVSNSIGGYPLGAVLWYVENGAPKYLVQSLVENNVTSDLTNTEKWQPLTLNPTGMAMTGTLTDVKAGQVRNIEIVDQEPTTGTDGTIYAIIEG